MERFGMVDVWRELNPGTMGAYTYWARSNGRKEGNEGWRIDLFVSDRDTFRDRVLDCTILPEVSLNYSKTWIPSSWLTELQYAADDLGTRGSLSRCSDVDSSKKSRLPDARPVDCSTTEGSERESFRNFCGCLWNQRPWRNRKAKQNTPFSGDNFSSASLPCIHAICCISCQGKRRH